MQSYSGSQPSLETFQQMWSFVLETEGVVELIVNCLDHLAQPSQPATQPFRPRMPGVAFGRTHDLTTVQKMPSAMKLFALEALVRHIVTLCWLTGSCHSWMRLAPKGKEVFS